MRLPLSQNCPKYCCITLRLMVRSFFRQFPPFGQRFENTVLLKGDRPSECYLAGAVDSSLCRRVAVRLNRDS